MRILAASGDLHGRFFSRARALPRFHTDKTHCGSGVWHRSSRGWLPDQLLDHLVGGEKQRLGDRETERLGGFEVDYQLVLGWRLHRKVTRVSSA